MYLWRATKLMFVNQTIHLKFDHVSINNIQSVNNKIYNILIKMFTWFENMFLLYQTMLKKLKFQIQSKIPSN